MAEQVFNSVAEMIEAQQVQVMGEPVKPDEQTPEQPKEEVKETPPVSVEPTEPQDKEEEVEEEEKQEELTPSDDRVYKLVVDGDEIVLTEKQAISQIQKALTADKRLEQVATERKHVEQLQQDVGFVLGALKGDMLGQDGRPVNPFDVIAQLIGFDKAQEAGLNWFAGIAELENNPDKKIEHYKNEAEKWKKQAQQPVKQTQQTQNIVPSEEVQLSLEQDVTNALQKAGLPTDQDILYQLMAGKVLENKDDPNFTMDKAAQWLVGEVNAVHSKQYGSADPEKYQEAFPEITKRVREHDIEKYKKTRRTTPKKGAPSRASREPKTYNSFAEWRKDSGLSELPGTTGV